MSVMKNEAKYVRPNVGIELNRTGSLNSGQIQLFYIYLLSLKD